MGLSPCSTSTSRFGARIVSLGAFARQRLLLRQPSESLLACDGRVPRCARAAQRGRLFGERRAARRRRLGCCQAGYAAQRRCGPVGRIESCDIKGSSDASIKNVVPAHVERIAGAAPIEQVIARVVSWPALQALSTKRTGLPAVVLPSTSPANAAWRLGRLVERWHEAIDWGAL